MGSGWIRASSFNTGLALIQWKHFFIFQMGKCLGTEKKKKKEDEKTIGKKRETIGLLFSRVLYTLYLFYTVIC